MSQSKDGPDAMDPTMSSGGKPTLKTIARISGLAVPTVSRALNDAPDIGQGTKKLVRKIASEIGYVPNRAGVRLRTGRTNVISVVMSAGHDNHTARFISAIAGELEGTPFHLNVTPYASDEELMKPVRYIVETASADAVILNQIEPEDPRVAYLIAHRFPFATHGRTMWADQHAYYDFDNETYGRLAIDMLHKRGRRHIGVVAPPQKQSYCSHLVAGLRARAAANGQTVIILEQINNDDPGDKVLHGIGEHLRAYPQTDAIITASTNAAIVTIAGVENAGRKLAKDIDVFAKEAVPFLKLVRPDVLTMSESVGSAGVFLARAAMQAIKDPTSQPMQHLEIPLSSEVEPQ